MERVELRPNHEVLCCSGRALLANKPQLSISVELLCFMVLFPPCCGKNWCLKAPWLSRSPLEKPCPGVLNLPNWICCELLLLSSILGVSLYLMCTVPCTDCTESTGNNPYINISFASLVPRGAC